MDAFINQILRTLAAMPPDDVQPIPHDEPMDTDDHDDLPELQPVSDSDDELGSDSSQDEVEEEEVMMQTVDDNDNENVPPLEPISRPHTSNRRPRVDDDDDEERDRRHPSQRINNPLDVMNPTVAQIPPSFNGPINTLPASPRMSDAVHEGQDNQNQSNQNQQPQQPQPRRQRLPIINGFAVTIDINGQRIVRPLPGVDPANQGLGFADFLGFLSALSERESDDPERAKQLVDALEEVPVGLVRRLEALNGKTPTGNVEGEETGAGDCSCAICWDTLLDGEGGFGVDGDDKAQDEAPQHMEGEDTSAPSSLSSPPSPDTAPAPAPAPSSSTKQVSSTDPTQPKIVSLPCAHVFHAACLIPWFSRPRQTTCPTCRFNIDPERLTANRQPFYSFDVRNRWGERQGQQRQTGEQQQQQGEGTPSPDTNTDVPTSPGPQAQAQATTAATADQQQPQPQRNPGHIHGALPGAVLTIGFDIIIGPNPNLGGHNANSVNPNANTNPDLNPAQNTNMNPDAGAGVENAAQDQNQHQHQHHNQNQNADPTFMGFGMGPGGMGMGMGIGGMGDMHENEIEEVTMMDLSDVQARELGEILRVALPPHRHSAPAAANSGAGVDGAQPQQGQQQQQQQQQQQRPPPGPLPGVFAGAGTRTMGEALASFLTQALQAPPQGQGPNQRPAGVNMRGNQPQGGQQPREHENQGESVGEQHGQADAQGQDFGRGQQQGQQAGQGQGQGPAQMLNTPALRDFLNAVFSSIAQGQGQRQTRGAGAGAGQGAQAQPQNQAQARQEGQAGEERHEHEQQPQPQILPQSQNEQPRNVDGHAFSPGVGGVPGFVSAPMPLVQPAGTLGGTPVFNLGNLFADLDALGSGADVGGRGGNQANVNNNTGADVNDETNGFDAGGNAHPNAAEATANPNAANANANLNVHPPGPAMNIPFIPFASLFPGATLTPPPAFGTAQPAQPPVQAAQHEQGEQPAGPQQQAQADALNGFMRILPDAIFGQGFNVANGTNAPNVPPQPQQPQQPQQQAGGGALPLPPWARFFQPQLFNPFNFGPVPAGAAQPAQAQAQAQTQPEGQAQPETHAQAPPTGPPRFRPTRAPREKKPWTLPPPPGPTLRQRIEKREREAGLRCYDVSCGAGPSDEEPFLGVGMTERARRQLSIRALALGGDEEMEKEVLCEHTFHPACLVSAARVANALGEDVSVGHEDFVEVSCSVCRGVGSIRRGDWDEGVSALA